jgi:hypothetical protein
MNQGTNWVLLMKKNRSQKSRASVPLRRFGDIPVQSFGSHIRPQPPGLGLTFFLEKCYQKRVGTMLPPL